ncbi:ABC transporter permease [Streptomyces sp. NPDC048172]|uniref:ABC transporter permease n=1 Tax=Streptomyces sp. NPDC048172 TaxID=3365505 RepID=UPI00371E71AB
MTTYETYGVTFPRVLRAEWGKLWSLRSTWYALGGTVVLVLALAVGAGIATDDTGNGPAGDPMDVSLFGVNFAQLILPVLGALTTAGEYANGSVRSTMTAVPRRLPVLWAKSAVFGAVVLVLLLAAAFAAFPLAQLFLADTPLAASFGDPGVVRALCGAAASTALLGVLGLALGALLRSAPAAIGVFVIVLTALPQFASALPYAWVDTAVRHTPLPAGQGLMAVLPQPDFPGPLAGLVTLTVWAAVTLGAAAVLLRQRDV